MEKQLQNISDNDLIAKVEKCFLGKKNLPREIIYLTPKIKFEPSPMSKISHILFTDRSINEDNIQRNFSQEQNNMILRGNNEIIKFLKQMKETVNELTKDQPKIHQIKNSSEIIPNCILSEILVNRKQSA